jgi:hypothetical protein
MAMQNSSNATTANFPGVTLIDKNLVNSAIEVQRQKIEHARTLVMTVVKHLDLVGEPGHASGEGPVMWTLSSVADMLAKIAADLDIENAKETLPVVESRRRLRERLSFT